MSQENENYIYLYTGPLRDKMDRVAEVYMMPHFQDYTRGKPTQIILMAATDTSPQGEVYVGGSNFMSTVFPETVKPQWEYLRKLEWREIGEESVPQTLLQEVAEQRLSLLESPVWKRMSTPYKDGTRFLIEMQMAVFSGGPSTPEHGSQLMNAIEKLIH